MPLDADFPFVEFLSFVLFLCSLHNCSPEAITYYE